MGLRGYVWHGLGQQLRNPTGWAGRLVGRMMRIANHRPTRLALDALAIRPGDRLLDLGCGSGQAIRAMTRRARAGWVHGFDQSAVMIDQARRLNRRALATGRVQLTAGDFAALPYPPGSFDGILASNVIYFWPDRPAMLAQLRALLAPGGRLSIYATDAQSMRRWKFAQQDTHSHITALELRHALLAAGFGPNDIAIDLHDVGGGVIGIVGHAVKTDPAT